MSSDLAPERPRTIGRYLLIATIGSGGMAEVFLAVAQGPGGFNKLLVTKVLRSSLADDETFRSMFLDEARLAARMNHPNIPQTYEVGESGEHHFLTMEYLEGQPLNRVTTKVKEMPLEQRVHILAQVLAGLHYAHELTDYDGSLLEVVHRDISPHNVFVTYDGQVKLMDFGIAKTANASTQTATGVIKGKISYMAPEQALAQPVDRRTDIFAVGVMLWEALANQRMNAGDESEVATLQKRVSGPVPSPATVNPLAPSELVDICTKAVAFDPKDRFATAAEFQEQLETYLEKRGLVAKPRDLGKLVTEAFAEKRQRLQQSIERQLSAAKSSSSSLQLVDLAREATGSRSSVTATDEGGPGSSSHSKSSVGMMATAAEPVTQTSARPSGGKLAALAMIPIAAVGIFVAVSRHGGPSSNGANGSGETSEQMNNSPVAAERDSADAAGSGLGSGSGSSANPASPSTGTSPASTVTATPTAATTDVGSAPNVKIAPTAGATTTTPVPVPVTVPVPVPNHPHGSPNHPPSTRTVDDKDPYAQ